MTEKPIPMSPEQARRIKAVMDVRMLLDPFPVQDRLSIALMVATKTVEEILILYPDATRGKIVKAAQEDFGKMLHKHARPKLSGSGPSEELPADHPARHQEPDPGKLQ